MSSTTEEVQDREGRRRPGRKRDPSVDQRILTAAIDVYASEGWAKFNFDTVARLAQVGKPAMYRRWTSREELLGAAVESLSKPYMPEDTGSLRQDLHDWSIGMFEWWDTPIGMAYGRLQVEHRFYPELERPYFELINRPHTAIARNIVRRAIERGELPETTDIDLVLEAINGAIYTRVSTTRPHARAKLLRRREQFVDRLLDLLLGMAGI